MDFDFDSQENVLTTKTPSVKPLNFKSHKGIGLWISDENAKICKWKKDLEFSQYYKQTTRNIKGNEGNIPGNVIVNP